MDSHTRPERKPFTLDVSKEWCEKMAKLEEGYEVGAGRTGDAGGSGTKFGLRDTVDNVWMGDDAGPALYSDQLVARVAAQVLDVRLKQEPGRTRAIEYSENAIHLKDHVKPTMSTLEALRRIEDGAL